MLPISEKIAKGSDKLVIDDKLNVIKMTIDIYLSSGGENKTHFIKLMDFILSRTSTGLLVDETLKKSIIEEGLYSIVCDLTVIYGKLNELLHPNDTFELEADDVYDIVFSVSFVTEYCLSLIKGTKSNER